MGTSHLHRSPALSLPRWGELYTICTFQLGRRRGRGAQGHQLITDVLKASFPSIITSGTHGVWPQMIQLQLKVAVLPDHRETYLQPLALAGSFCFSLLSFSRTPIRIQVQMEIMSTLSSCYGLSSSYLVIFMFYSK